MEGMIRRLQRRFIVIATFAVVILLMISLGMVNLFNFSRARQEVNAILNVLVEHEGVFPEDPEELRDDQLYDDSEEAYYQTRYFSVWMNEKGDVQEINLKHIAAISEQEAGDLAKHICERGRSIGRFLVGGSVYAYKCRQMNNGRRLIVVLNCTRNLQTARSFLQNSICLGVILTLLYAAILTFISRRVIEPMRRNIESQKQFITNAGHELKTPLAIISANVEVLEMLNGKNEWTDSILNQTKRGTQLVDRLIVMAKAGEREEVILSDVNFSLAAEEAASSFRSVAEKDGKHLELSIMEDVHVLAEERYLRELVNILTDNGVKYCDAGGTITVQLSGGKGKNARLTVSNPYKDGEKVDYSRFFERFYRADSSHARGARSAGYGIGLAMAQDLTTLFKGNISVAYSVKKKEISFTVVLPAKKL